MDIQQALAAVHGACGGDNTRLARILEQAKAYLQTQPRLNKGKNSQQCLQVLASLEDKARSQAAPTPPDNAPEGTKQSPASSKQSSVTQEARAIAVSAVNAAVSARAPLVKTLPKRVLRARTPQSNTPAASAAQTVPSADVATTVETPQDKVAHGAQLAEAAGAGAAQVPQGAAAPADVAATKGATTGTDTGPAVGTTQQRPPQGENASTKEPCAPRVAIRGLLTRMDIAARRQRVLQSMMVAAAEVAEARATPTSRFKQCAQEACMAASTAEVAHEASRHVRAAVCKGVLAYHTEASAEWTRRKEEARRKRLLALRSSNLQEYLAELQNTRSERLSEMLRQTDECLRTLAERVGLNKLLKKQDLELLITGKDTTGPDGNKNSEKNAQGTQGPATHTGAGKDPGAQATGAAHTSKAGRGDGVSGVVASSSAWDRLAKSLTANIGEQPKTLQGGTLRPYQMHGLRWMVALRDLGLGGILADDMGLGKTVQVIALICYCMETRGDQGPYLIAAPASVLQNWAAEFKRWAPSVKVVVYHGSPEKRESLYNESVSSTRKHGDVARFNVLLTTYEYLMGKNDRPRLTRLAWSHLIIDEGHRMKNADCKLARELAAYKTRCRLLLTGTPLQNHLSELWSLLHFLLPGAFGDVDDFNKWFAQPLEALRAGGAAEVAAGDMAGGAGLTEEEFMLATNRLHQVLRPFVLRRLVSSVATELPSKEERCIRCPQTPYQRALNQIVRQRLLSGSSAGDTSVTGSEAGGTVSAPAPTTQPPQPPQPQQQLGTSLRNTMMELRKIANHPLLSTLHPPHAEDILGLMTTAAQQSSSGAAPSAVPPLISLSGKMDVLDRLLLKLHTRGHKVLLFCTMTSVLDLIEDLLHWRGLSDGALRLDGSTSAGERGDLIARFNDKGPNTPWLFLLSLRAGGVGLNLQAADRVIMYDTDFNPQADLQAQARAHRIGQKNKVMVIRLVTDQSIEDHILSVATEKRRFADSSITGGFFDGQTSDHERRNFLLNLLQENANTSTTGAGEGGRSTDPTAPEPPTDTELEAAITPTTHTTTDTHNTPTTNPATKRKDSGGKRSSGAVAATATQALPKSSEQPHAQVARGQRKSGGSSGADQGVGVVGAGGDGVTGATGAAPIGSVAVAAKGPSSRLLTAAQCEPLFEAMREHNAAKDPDAGKVFGKGMRAVNALLQKPVETVRTRSPSPGPTTRAKSADSAGGPSQATSKIDTGTTGSGKVAKGGQPVRGRATRAQQSAVATSAAGTAAAAAAGQGVVADAQPQGSNTAARAAARSQLKRKAADMQVSDAAAASAQAPAKAARVTRASDARVTADKPEQPTATSTLSAPVKGNAGLQKGSAAGATSTGDAMDDIQDTATSPVATCKAAGSGRPTRAAVSSLTAGAAAGTAAAVAAAAAVTSPVAATDALAALSPLPAGASQAAEQLPLPRSLGGSEGDAMGLTGRGSAEQPLLLLRDGSTGEATAVEAACATLPTAHQQQHTAVGMATLVASATRVPATATAAAAAGVHVSTGPVAADPQPQQHTVVPIRPRATRSPVKSYPGASGARTLPHVAQAGASNRLEAPGSTGQVNTAAAAAAAAVGQPVGGLPTPAVAYAGQAATAEAALAASGAPFAAAAPQLDSVDGAAGSCVAAAPAATAAVVPADPSVSADSGAAGVPQYTGTVWNRRTKAWLAYITVDSVLYNMGRYATAEEAAHAHDVAALLALGRDASLNFPDLYQHATQAQIMARARQLLSPECMDKLSEACGCQLPAQDLPFEVTGSAILPQDPAAAAPQSAQAASPRAHGARTAAHTAPSGRARAVMSPGTSGAHRSDAEAGPVSGPAAAAHADPARAAQATDTAVAAGQPARHTPAAAAAAAAGSAAAAAGPTAAALTGSGDTAQPQQVGSQPQHYVGISFYKPSQKWRAYIRVNKSKTQIMVGMFDTVNEAAHARDVAAVLALGRDVKLNFSQTYANMTDAQVHARAVQLLGQDKVAGLPVSTATTRANIAVLAASLPAAASPAAQTTVTAPRHSSAAAAKASRPPAATATAAAGLPAGSSPASPEAAADLPATAATADGQAGAVPAAAKLPAGRSSASPAVWPEPTPGRAHTAHEGASGDDQAGAAIVTGPSSGEHSTVAQHTGAGAGGGHYVGTSFNKAAKKWLAYIRVNNSKKMITLGFHVTAMEAAYARDAAAALALGRDVKLNFPQTYESMTDAQVYERAVQLLGEDKVAGLPKSRATVTHTVAVVPAADLPVAVTPHSSSVVANATSNSRAVPAKAAAELPAGPSLASPAARPAPMPGSAPSPHTAPVSSSGGDGSAGAATGAGPDSSKPDQTVGEHSGAGAEAVHYAGTSFREKGQRWLAYIRVDNNKKQITLGLYATAVEAAHARDAAAALALGRDVKLNFPEFYQAASDEQVRARAVELLGEDKVARIAPEATAAVNARQPQPKRPAAPSDVKDEPHTGAKRTRRG